MTGSIPTSSTQTRDDGVRELTYGEAEVGGYAGEIEMGDKVKIRILVKYMSNVRYNIEHKHGEMSRC